MKIILTGGAGYIGSHAVKKLISQNHEVIVVDNLSTGLKSLLLPNVKFYNADITKINELEMIFKNEKNVDAIFHFAALISVPESVDKPNDYFLVNTFGTINLMIMAEKYNIDNFVFSSTAAVYGVNNSSDVITENSDTNPINPYGASKLSAEIALTSWAKVKNKNFVIFRYFNVSGMQPGTKAKTTQEKELSSDHLIPFFNMYQLGIKKEFFIFGNDYNTPDGTCVRDYIHVVDLVDAHILGLKWAIESKKSGIFNLGIKNGVSVNEVVKKAQEITKNKLKIHIAPRRQGDPATLVASNENAKRILKWSPQFNLREMILTDYEFRK